MLLALQDPDIVDDLRSYNGNNVNEKLLPFWDMFAKVLSEYAQAAHARRHGESGAGYLSDIISIPQLRRNCITRLQEEHG